MTAATVPGVRFTRLRNRDAYRVWHWDDEIGRAWRPCGQRHWLAWDGTSPYAPVRGRTRADAAAALARALGRAAA